VVFERAKRRMYGRYHRVPSEELAPEERMQVEDFVREQVADFRTHLAVQSRKSRSKSQSCLDISALCGCGRGPKTRINPILILDYFYWKEGSRKSGDDQGFIWRWVNCLRPPPKHSKSSFVD